jgi:D-alanyl-D-alanine carboxypeptidase
MPIKLLDILKKEISEQGDYFKGMVLPSGKKTGDVIGALEFDDQGGFVKYIDPKDVGSKYGEYDENATYVEDSLLGYHSRAQKDKDDGIINPNLISDIIKALRIAGISAEIHYARTDHDKYTSNGNISRHYVGSAVDISVISGLGNAGGNGANKGIGNAKFMEDGDKIVDALKKIGYKFGESGNVKGYLWRTDTGGNHWNHIHVSNTDREEKIGNKIVGGERGENYKKLPQKIKDSLQDLKDDWKTEITDEHVDKEFDQEGTWRSDNGGVDQTAKTNIEKLIKDCNSKFSITGGIVSGYRSYDDQVDNFGRKVRIDGRTIEDVQASNSLPGFSQHHTGKAFDIYSVDPSWWDARPNVKKWVANNAKNYGFEITYKTKGTLRNAEPWHLYFIGSSTKDDEVEDKKEGVDVGEVKKETIVGSSYVIDLNGPNSKYISLIWGGTPSASYGADYMKTQGEGFFTNKNIIYSDHENSLTKIKEIIKKELGDGYKIKSVSGFSKGGEKTWSEINSGFDFVGLIDPSTSFVRNTLPDNVKMMSYYKNWSESKYPNIRSVLKKMEDNGVSERVEVGHFEIPKKFFSKYSDKY